MAAIKNYISLQDNMTPVFRSILKSMDSTLRVMRIMDAQSGKGAQSKAYRAAERDLKRANNEMIRFQNNLAGADRGAAQLAKTVSGVAVKESWGSFITGIASAVHLAERLVNAMSEVANVSDTLRTAQYRLETYDTTEASGAELFDAAYLTAQASRSDINSTASLASRILVTGATNGSGAEAIHLAGILNKASFIGGSSQEESKRALLQLSQGLASGTLQGDELRAIREQSPGLTDTLAKGLSSLAEKGALPDKFLGVTMGDLKQLGADGELTADRIIAAFKEMEDYVDSTFESSPKQFGQAVTGILNVWSRWLKLMGEGDNALAKINQKAWDLLEWFESSDGDRFFETLSVGINVAVDGLFKLIDWLGDTISWLIDTETGTQVLSSAFYALGIVAAIAATMSIISWIKACWQILVAVAAIGALIYAFQELGYESDNILGDIAGGIAWLAVAAWNTGVAICAIVAWVGMAAWDLVLVILEGLAVILIYAVTLALSIVVLAIQLIAWILGVIDTVILAILLVVYSLGAGLVGIFLGVVSGIYQLFVWLASGILEVLAWIASGIDEVFGTSLSDTLKGFSEDLKKSAEWMWGLTGDVFESIPNQWEGAVDYTVDRFTTPTNEGGLSTWFAQEGLWNGAYGLSQDVVNFGDSFSAIGNGGYEDVWNWYAGLLGDPDAAFAGGQAAGQDVQAMLDNAKLEMDKLTGIMDSIENGTYISGGDLDSIGRINSDVEISEEDIKLLRDVAARDYLLTLQTSTPQINNNFGDVRETADVNAILDTIQDMVDEQLAATLVVN